MTVVAELGVVPRALPSPLHDVTRMPARPENDIDVEVAPLLRYSLINHIGHSHCLVGQRPDPLLQAAPGLDHFSLVVARNATALQEQRPLAADVEDAGGGGHVGSLRRGRSCSTKSALRRRGKQTRAIGATRLGEASTE